MGDRQGNTDAKVEESVMSSATQKLYIAEGVCYFTYLKNYSLIETIKVLIE
jgi:hypothetical protein